MAPEDFSTTKMTVEIEATTQNGPESAMNLVKNLLACPAIKSVKIVSAESNYQLHKLPAEKMSSVEIK